MKILFLMRHEGYIRYYESVIYMLAEKGCNIHMGFTRQQNKVFNNDKAVEMANVSKNISFTYIEDRNDVWSVFAQKIRSYIDYLRYVNPLYQHSDKLVKRSSKRVSKLFVCIINLLPNTIKYSLSRFLIYVLKSIENVIPADKSIIAYLRSVNPDIVLFTPMVDSSTVLVDYLKSARKIGLRNALCVASWDNLTNKGLIQIIPDKVFVWNDIQKKEAIMLHNIRKDKIIITGAQVFDDWFDKQPSVTREQFYHKINLDQSLPYIIYLCSSGFVAKDEVNFIRQWINALRNSNHELLRKIGILIRPDPNNIKQWVDHSGFGHDNVSVWPKYGAVPFCNATRNDYFDSMYYSVGAVGLNTSALLEVGILNKPVFTITPPEYRLSQDGTLHFHYLVRGGLVLKSSNLREHIDQLYTVICEDSTRSRSRMSFIKNFIRPRGLDKPCTPIMVNELEKMMDIIPEPDSRSVLLSIIEIFLKPFAFIMKLLNRLPSSTDDKTTKSDLRGISKYYGKGAPKPVVFKNKKNRSAKKKQLNRRKKKSGAFNAGG